MMDPNPGKQQMLPYQEKGPLHVWLIKDLAIGHYHGLYERDLNEVTIVLLRGSQKEIWDRDEKRKGKGYVYRWSYSYGLVG